jgi:hypothetical protein
MRKHSNKPRLINNPKLPQIIDELADINISGYDLFRMVMELNEGKEVLNYLLEEIPQSERYEESN